MQRPVPANQPSHHLFIDEVGTAGIPPATNPIVVHDQYFGLCGVIVSSTEMKANVAPQWRAFLNGHFGQANGMDVLFHRTCFLNGRGPFSSMRNRLFRQQRSADIVALVSTFQFDVCAVCIDKRAHFARHGANAFDPYTYCMEILLERFVFALERKSGFGDVIAEARNPIADRAVRDAYANLWKAGTSYVDARRIQGCLTARHLKTRPKAAGVVGLEVSDLVANAGFLDTLQNHGVPTRFGPFENLLLPVLASRYPQHKGNINGCGRKLLK